MPSYSGDAYCVDKVGDSLINAYGSWCSYGHGHNCWCYCIEAYPFNPRHYAPITTRPITCHGAHGMHKCILGHPTHQTRHHTCNNQPTNQLTNQLTNQPTIDLLDIYLLPWGNSKPCNNGNLPFINHKQVGNTNGSSIWQMGSYPKWLTRSIHTSNTIELTKANCLWVSLNSFIHLPQVTSSIHL